MSAVAGSLVTAIESVWEGLRRQHPDVPDVVVAVASGSTGRRGIRLGQFGPDRWQLHGKDWMPELFVGGEGFAFGARDVMATLLHEAAHGVARARGVSETSRAGAYHNGRYRDLAQEFGLTVERDKGKGWATTTLLDDAAHRYQPEIDVLAAALVAHRRSEHAEIGGHAPGTADGPGDEAEGEGEERSPRNGRALTCTCSPARRIRAHQRTIDAGAILCAVCKEPFRSRE